MDERVLKRMSEIHRPVLDRIMVLFTYAGTGGFIWLVAFVIPFLITRRYRETSVILAAALGVNYLIGEVLIKKSVGRDRPSTWISDEDMKINKPKDHSFPSGHSASSFCAFTVTAWCSSFCAFTVTAWCCPPWIWIPALLLACAIAFSRMYLRVHYLTDVLGGIVLGIIDGSLVTLIFKAFIFKG